MRKKVLFSSSNVTEQDESCAIGLLRHTVRNRICETPCCIMCVMTVCILPLLPRTEVASVWRHIVLTSSKIIYCINPVNVEKL